MIETFNSENQADWPGRYSETYGVLLANARINRNTVVLINSVNDDKLLFTNEDGLNLWISVDSNIQFEFKPLKTGWRAVNENRIYWVKRRSDRQWKRGLCSSNTNIGFLGAYGIDYIPLDFIVISELLTVKDDYAASVMRWLENQKGACAMNKYFALNNNNCYFMDTRIGTVENNCITMLDDTCKQELMDCIRRNNYPFQVTM